MTEASESPDGPDEGGEAIEAGEGLGAAAPDDGDLLDSRRLLMRYREQGDREALEELMRRYYPRVIRKVRVLMSARVASRHEPEDITQSVMRTGLEQLDQFEFREPAGLINWLSAIALNKIRSRARGRSSEEVSLPVLPEEGDEEPGPPGALLSREAEEMIDRAVSLLAPDRRAVVLARDYDGGSWAHVAEQLGRSPEACQMLYHRARLELRKSLRSLEPETDSEP